MENPHQNHHQHHEECPPQLETPRYSSTTSPLPKEELDQLRACIETANELLRTLSIRRDPDFFYRLMLRLRELRGLLVQVEVECEQMQTMQHFVGKLQDAGRDFLTLSLVGERLLIPFSRICNLVRDACGENGAGHGTVGGHHGGRLADIDPALRRQLVLHFGEVVSCSPELINIFFGTPLYLQLLHHLGRKVVVVTDEAEVKGVLCESEEGQIQVLVAEQTLEQINLADICFVKLLY